MNIAAKKIELVRLILNTEKPAVLARIAGILKQEEVDWREGLPEEVIKSVERGLEQAKAGNTVSHDDVMDKYRKWH
jgi:predicted transcriptional regulator